MYEIDIDRGREKTMTIKSKRLQDLWCSVYDVAMKKKKKIKIQSKRGEK